jgi:hypothetical protein
MQTRYHASVLILYLSIAVAMLATGLMRSPSLHQRGGSLQLTAPPPSVLYMYSSDFDDVTDEARETPGYQRVASAVALVSGTTVGAGILALASVSQVNYTS